MSSQITSVCHPPPCSAYKKAVRLTHPSAVKCGERLQGGSRRTPSRSATPLLRSASSRRCCDEQHHRVCSVLKWIGISRSEASVRTASPSRRAPAADAARLDCRSRKHAARSTRSDADRIAPHRAGDVLTGVARSGTREAMGQAAVNDPVDAAKSLPAVRVRRLASLPPEDRDRRHVVRKSHRLVAVRLRGVHVLEGT